VFYKKKGKNYERKITTSPYYQGKCPDFEVNELNLGLVVQVLIAANLRNAARK